MKQVVRVVLFAVLTTLVCELGVRAIAPAFPETTTWREPIVAAKAGAMDAIGGRGGVDVVFAGSSQMLFAGDPVLLRERGVPWRSYNAGIWGAPPVVSEHWVPEVVIPRTRASTVVFGVSPVDFVPAATGLAVDNYFASLAVRDDVLGSIDRTLSRYSALVRDRKVLRSPIALGEAIGRRVSGDDGPALPATGIDIGGRMSRRDKDAFRGDAVARELIAGVVDNGWRVSGRQRDAFRGTVRALNDANIDVVVADMPISAPMIELLGADGYGAYRAFLRREAAALGVPVLDTATTITDTRFFIDYDHLNRAGADAWNAIIAREVEP